MKIETRIAVNMRIIEVEREFYDGPMSIQKLETMRIERNHKASQQEAIQKIDSFLDELMKRDFPGGVAIKEPTKSWSGNTMNFSFKLKKGLISTKLAGDIQVEDGKIVMNSELPGLIRTFVSEEKISDVIGQQIDSLFPAKK